MSKNYTHTESTEGTTWSNPHNEIPAIYVYIYNIIPHKSYFVSPAISTAQIQKIHKSIA